MNQLWCFNCDTNYEKKLKGNHFNILRGFNLFIAECVHLPIHHNTNLKQVKNVQLLPSIAVRQKALLDAYKKRIVAILSHSSVKQLKPYTLKLGNYIRSSQEEKHSWTRNFQTRLTLIKQSYQGLRDHLSRNRNIGKLLELLQHNIMRRSCLTY